MFGKWNEEEEDDKPPIGLLRRLDDDDYDDIDKKILKQLMENGKTLIAIQKTLKRIEGRI